jgi:hypothetical protein
METLESSRCTPVQPSQNPTKTVAFSVFQAPRSKHSVKNLLALKLRKFFSCCFLFFVSDDILDSLPNSYQSFFSFLANSALVTTNWSLCYIFKTNFYLFTHFLFLRLNYLG